jgi:hypothetical protein
MKMLDRRGDEGSGGGGGYGQSRGAARPASSGTEVMEDDEEVPF